jgi:hypothetical protein
LEVIFKVIKESGLKEVVGEGRYKKVEGIPIASVLQWRYSFLTLTRFDRRQGGNS